MKTADGWQKLAEGWLQELEDRDASELTQFERDLLLDLQRNVEIDTTCPHRDEKCDPKCAVWATGESLCPDGPKP